ncbi:hypothetical protein GUT183_09020 [Streptococcus ruminantium]|nr:hypothetical protein GUT183_09020 [Streptococcus ruminantium]
MNIKQWNTSIFWMLIVLLTTPNRYNVTPWSTNLECKNGPHTPNQMWIKSCVADAWKSMND